VSVLVLNYRSPRDTVRSVCALYEQTYAEQSEVIVIDNHSEDDSIGIIRHQLQKVFPLRIVETHRNCGFGAGYNVGARFARGKYLLINNPAKILPRDGIERLVEHMEADSSIGILAPKLLHPDGTQRQSARTFPHPFDLVIKRTWLRYVFPCRVDRYVLAQKHGENVQDVDWVVGGCFLIRRSFFEELGGFDAERFFLFFEDMDLCRRCWLQEKRVVYTCKVIGSDRKRRLSDGGIFSLFTTRVGRAHIHSALRYFWKWRNLPNPRTSST